VLLESAGVVAFVFRELRAARPALDLTVFRNPVLALSNWRR
jgi:hypothetical protein